MEFESSKFGKCMFADMTQKRLEDFHRAMKGKENEPLSVWRGDSVRTAIKLGMMTEPVWKVEDVDNAKPSFVIWLSECLAKHLAEALDLDPLS